MCGIPFSCPLHFPAPQHVPAQNSDQRCHRQHNDAAPSNHVSATSNRRRIAGGQEDGVGRKILRMQNQFVVSHLFALHAFALFNSQTLTSAIICRSSLDSSFRDVYEAPHRR